jgi:hypothetical protein
MLLQLLHRSQVTLAVALLILIGLFHLRIYFIRRSLRLPCQLTSFFTAPVEVQAQTLPVPAPAIAPKHVSYASQNSYEPDPVANNSSRYADEKNGYLLLVGSGGEARMLQLLVQNFFTNSLFMDFVAGRT